VASGIDHAMHGQIPTALLYLGVTVANALFLSWLAVMVVSRHFDSAYDRAGSTQATGARPATPAAGGPAGWAFCYLPRPMRLVAAKDLRTFFRDPTQWSQLTILFGLLVLYLTNMPTLRLQLTASGWLLMIPFLNLCAVTLILATFTCRFVFPLVSLEGQKLWLMGVLPIPRSRLLAAKLAFAMTVTLVVALAAMVVAVILLRLDAVWAAIHLGVTIAICFGLCGFAVGIGARLPMFKQTNPARIANGLGGTTNLLASIALVTISLAGVGVATWRSRYLGEGQLPDALSLLYCAGAMVFSILGGIGALVIGARHLDRIDV
jgi:ABC-2 type transport system permease protein